MLKIDYLLNGFCLTLLYGLFWYSIPINIFFISVGNWLFDLVVGGEFSKKHGLAEFVLYTTAIGFFPIAAVMIILEHHLLKKNRNSASRMNEYIDKQEEKQAEPARDKTSTVVFSSDLTKDKIELQDGIDDYIT